MFKASRFFAHVLTLAAGAGTAGCGWILGLDEFTDQPPDAGTSPPAGCGSPADCPAGANGTATCTEGACGFACAPGFDDCDEEVGCETSTTGDKQNCGGCGVTCAAYCVEGSCNDPVDVVAADYHACALLKDGSVWCWGKNSSGELGAPPAMALAAQPRRVELGGPATQVAAGSRYDLGVESFEAHTCAALADRTVWCWGDNESGQLALGQAGGKHHPPTDVGLMDVDRIATGSRHTCASNINHELFCWGIGGFVGDGTTMNAYSPVKIPVSVGHVAAGEYHSCALTTEGQLQCWGHNTYGQLGVNSQDNQLSPTPVLGLVSPIEATCGSWHTCSVTGIGLFCWGDNSEGQLGLASAGGIQLTPQPLNLPRVDMVSAGHDHTGAVVGGEVYMWGANGSGQLGNGTAVSSATPAPIGLTDVRKLALGGLFSCALTESAAVLCWGDGKFGQLGDGTTASRSTPAAVVWP